MWSPQCWLPLGVRQLPPCVCLHPIFGVCFAGVFLFGHPFDHVYFVLSRNPTCAPSMLLDTTCENIQRP